MPLLTRASVADLTRSSVTLQPKRFQLFQPMGGVRARPLSRAREDGAQRRNPKKMESARRLIFFARVSMRPSRRILISYFRSATTELPALAKSGKLARDERKNQRREEKFTRWRLQPLRRPPLCRQ